MSTQHMTCSLTSRCPMHRDCDMADHEAQRWRAGSDLGTCMQEGHRSRAHASQPGGRLLSSGYGGGSATAPGMPELAAASRCCWLDRMSCTKATWNPLRACKIAHCKDVCMQKYTALYFTCDVTI